jgi:nicotinamide-nucleotide amidase
VQTSDTVPGIPIAGIEEKVRDFLERICERDWSVATAESCTGGLLASLLTDVEGCSHAFDRGFVTYSAAAKQELLGISREAIEREGVVSKAIAIQMAEAALARSNAMISLAITGFAGPASGDNEEGLVHFGCALREGPTAHREQHFGAIGRDPIRARCMEVAVDMMSEAL